MNSLEFDQDMIKRCSFRIAAGASSLADADDAEQIMREKLLVFDEKDPSKVPDGCEEPKAFAFVWARDRTKSELQTRRWKNSNRGLVPHVSINHESLSLEADTVDRDCEIDAAEIVQMLSTDELILLQMRYQESLSFRKIAKVLKIGRNAVQYRHKKILEKIRMEWEISI